MLAGLVWHNMADTFVKIGSTENPEYRLVSRGDSYYKTPISDTEHTFGFTCVPSLIRIMQGGSVEALSVSYDVGTSDLYLGGIFVNGYQWISGPVPESELKDVLEAICSCSRVEIRNVWRESVALFIKDRGESIILGDLEHRYHRMSLSTESPIH